MTTQRLNIKWIPFWMAALSATVLACGEDPSDAGQAMSGAGGTSDGAGGTSDGEGGSPTDGAGGSPSDGEGGSPSDGEGGSPTDGAGGSPSDGEGGSPSDGEGGSPTDGDPGDAEVEWLSVAGGSFPGGDSAAMPCTDVEAVLLHDQAELDQWAIDQGIANLDSIVDWTTETALGAVTLCSTSGHVLDGGDLVHDESDGLTAEFTVTHLMPSYDVPTVVWSVFSVEGRAWTGVSATTIE